jgi:pimeloyl-ACP methyl ester carboxylesterase
MKVSPALLESALNTPEKAIQMVNTFSRATLAPPNGAGSWVLAPAWPGPPRAGQQRSHESAACRLQGLRQLCRWQAAMTQVSCPLLFVLGEQDQMTPPKAAKGLIDAAKGAGKP